jgi:hypothetical protein
MNMRETPTRAMKGGSVSSALMLAFAEPMKAKLVDSIPLAPAARYCRTADKKPEIALELSRNWYRR